MYKTKTERFRLY